MNIVVSAIFQGAARAHARAVSLLYTVHFFFLVCGVGALWVIHHSGTTHARTRLAGRLTALLALR